MYTHAQIHKDIFATLPRRTLSSNPLSQIHVYAYKYAYMEIYNTRTNTYMILIRSLSSNPLSDLAEELFEELVGLQTLWGPSMSVMCVCVYKLYRSGLCLATPFRSCWRAIWGTFRPASVVRPMHVCYVCIYKRYRYTGLFVHICHAYAQCILLSVRDCLRWHLITCMHTYEASAYTVCMYYCIYRAWKSMNARHAWGTRITT